MPRRLSIIALLAAWLCASGAMLDVVQVFAWARMFTHYAQQMPVAVAAVETLDQGKPCPICLAVRHAREESSREQPANVASGIEKIVLAFHELEPVVFAPELEAWTEVRVTVPRSWRDSVPLPPPRDHAVRWLA